MVSACVRYVKKVLRKMSRVHEPRPKTQARKVKTSSDGSSVSGITMPTSSIGHLASESVLFWDAIEELRKFREETLYSIYTRKIILK